MKSEEFTELPMARHYLRIITEDCSSDTEGAILAFLRESIGCTALYAEPIQPYWKNPGQGEMSVSFLSELSMEQIQAMLADHWEGGAGDSRWSHIRMPYGTFLWLTT